jgi:hypothetical protein
MAFIDPMIGSIVVNDPGELPKAFIWKNLFPSALNPAQKFSAETLSTPAYCLPAQFAVR